jgi:dUTP pyrophosphatase
MIKYFLDKSRSPGVDLRFERKSDGASGYDIMANLATSRIISGRNGRWSVPTGLYLEMPRGVEGQVRTRSGLSRDHGVVVLNAPGTVDSDYRGEIMVTLCNTGDQDYSIVPGERIAQIVFCPVFPDCLDIMHHPGCMYHRSRDCILKRVERLDQLTHTVRGSSGHGSTGR